MRDLEKIKKTEHKSVYTCRDEEVQSSQTLYCKLDKVVSNRVVKK